MYLQASGWRVAKKDLIDLDIAALGDAQGLYTCSGNTKADQSFSCCLEVKEDMQVTRQVGDNGQSDLPVGTLRWRHGASLQNTYCGPPWCQRLFIFRQGRRCCQQAMEASGAVP